MVMEVGAPDWTCAQVSSDVPNTEVLAPYGSQPVISKKHFLRVIALLKRVRINAVRRMRDATDEGRANQWRFIWDPAPVRRARERTHRYLLLETMKMWQRAWNHKPRQCRTCNLWVNVGQWPDHCIGKKHRRHAGSTGGAMITGNGTVDATRENILSIINLLQALESAQNADVNVPVADPHAGTGVPWLFL